MNEFEELLAEFKLKIRELYEDLHKDSLDLTLIEGRLNSSLGDLVSLKYMKNMEQQKIDVRLDVDMDKLFKLREALREQLGWWPGVSRCMRALTENNGDIEKTIQWIAARKYSLL